MDPILFIGGCIFISVSFLSYFDRDRLWNLFNLERGWRNAHPERTPEWDERTKRQGGLYLLIGLVAIGLSFLIG